MNFFGKELGTTIRADVEAPPGGATGGKGAGVLIIHTASLV